MRSLIDHAIRAGKMARRAIASTLSRVWGAYVAARFRRVQRELFFRTAASWTEDSLPRSDQSGVPGAPSASSGGASTDSNPDAATEPRPTRTMTGL
jgi:hypothetical protein